MRNTFFGFSLNSQGALHDETSLMLMNNASVADLNSRLDNEVTAAQFRPNFVVKDAIAFDEDKWKWIKIGENVITKNVRPCAR
jgi:uncharacterized protein YcbX